MRILHDLRIGLRALRRRPLLTLTALLTLGVAIGVNTAVFSVVYSILLQDLPYVEPGRLVTISLETLPEEGRPGGVARLNTDQVRALQEHASTLDGVAAYIRRELTFTGNGIPEVVQALAATPNLFQVLGVRQTRGLGFAGLEDGPATSEILLTRALAERRLGAEPRAGDLVRVDQAPRVVTHVVAPDFFFPSPEVEAWVPWSLAGSVGPGGSITTHYPEVVARLAEEATVEQAGQEVEQLLHRFSGLAAADGRTAASRVRVLPLRDALVGDVRPALLVVTAAAALVLLLACLNLVNLLLARNAERRQAIAIQTALGGTRRGVIRQLLAENFILSLGGGVLGILLALAVHGLLPHLLPPEALRVGKPVFGTAVLAFALCASLLTGLAAALLPIRHMTRTRLPGLLTGGWNTPPVAGFQRGWLVVFEVALAAVLMVSCLLLVRSFDRLMSTAWGYPESILTGTLQLDPARYGPPQRFTQLLDELLPRLQAYPAIEVASVVSYPPFPSSYGLVSTDIEGLPTARRFALPQLTTPELPGAMGLEILRGRWIEPSEHASGAAVAVVNQAYVSRYIPDEEIVGRRIILGQDELRVVGVVESVRLAGPQIDPAAAVYVSYRRVAELGTPSRAALMIRTRGDMEALVPFLQSTLTALDPELPLRNVETLGSRRASAVAQPRLLAVLVSLFAAMALLLSVSGIYGVLAQRLAAQERAIGIRRALGAAPARVVTLVLREGMTWSLVGIAVGLAAAWLLAGILEQVLFEVSSREPWSYLVTGAVLLVAALAACLVPLRRALRIDPIDVLRQH